MFKFSNKGQAAVYAILVIIVLASLAMSGGFSKHFSKNLPSESKTLLSNKYSIVYPSTTTGNKSLQLGTFLIKTITPIPTVSLSPTVPFVSPTPTQSRPTPFLTVIPTKYIPLPPPDETPTLPPGNWCERDDKKPPGLDCQCQPDEREEFGCYDTPEICEKYGSGFPNCLIPPGDIDQYRDNPKCGPSCIGKPVIYLYPTKTMFVNVKLDVPGRIIESDPLYPNEGWKNVEAHPDGTLIYKGKTYRELYYESLVDKVPYPEEGIIIASKDIELKLRQFLTRLGLISYEQQEFMEYWMPRLKELNARYIFFSVLTPEEKDSIDHVEISPKPDTKIEFLVYFKKLNNIIPVKPLKLPDTPPKRIGFTSVEWGGTIGY